MSCAGHLQEGAARREFINKLKVTAVIQNVTVEELAAIQEFLDEYRRKRKQ